VLIHRGGDIAEIALLEEEVKLASLRPCSTVK